MVAPLQSASRPAAPATTTTNDPPALAARILADNSRNGRPNLSEVRRDLDALAARDPDLGARVRTALEALLTPVQQGQLASTSYTVTAPDGGGIAFSDNAPTVAQDFARPADAGRAAFYARLDRIWGDGNPRTNDVAKIEAGLNDLRANGLSLAAYEAAHAATAAPAATGPDPAGVALDVTQIGLDIVGIFEPTPFADLTNAAISLGRKDWLGAGLSVLGVIPYAGDVAKLGKLGKWAETVANAVELAASNPAAKAALEPALRGISDALGKIPRAVLDGLPADARHALDGIKSKLDDFFAAGPKRIEMSGGKKGGWPPELNAKALEPNAEYLVNGYRYATDAKGRVTRAEGTLDLQTAQRNGYQQGVAGRSDRLPDDQGGHLIASIFNGPGDRLNLVPMNGNFNMGAWRSMEAKLADALAAGKKVDVKIDVIYTNGSARPTGFSVDYVIDGVKNNADFMNRAGG